MPSFGSKLIPSLELVRLGKREDVPAQAQRVEREIKRSTLLEIAPDRESLLMSDRSIDEIRQELRIRVDSRQSRGSHWLYRTRVRMDIKLSDNTARMSTLFPKPPRTVSVRNSDSDSDPDEDATLAYVDSRTGSRADFNWGLSRAHTVRRSMSDGQINPQQVLGMSIPSAWGDKRLSTEDQLISPRPLGATHILCLHTRRPTADAPLAKCVPGETVDCVINDLVFVLNAPGLADAAVLPHRLPDELPRVLMYVRDTRTFPPLVVYLHTKNQAELFRALVPEWIRDRAHPVFLPSPPASTPTRARSPPLRSKKSILSLRRGSADAAGDASLPVHGPAPHSPAEARLQSVARQIAQDDRDWYGDGEEDSLLATASRIAALADNMADVGFFGADVWAEIDTYTTLLRCAVNWSAKLAARLPMSPK